MTKDQFLTLCELAGVAPAVALESDELRAALEKRDDVEAARIIAEEF